jgi:RNA polymerase sigma-70 factor (ECF subfamily)
LSASGFERPLLGKVNDQQLLAAYLQGDECALEELIARYHRLVFATAARAAGDAHLGQDITQTVFIIFVRKAHRLSNEVSLPGWFLRTARFVVRDALKKLARRAHYEAAGGAHLRDQKKSHPVDTGAALLLTEAVLALSSKEQVCVLARFYEECTVAQIAQEHELSEDAVQKRIERGLGKMRAFFARRGFRVAAGAVPGLFAASFPPGAEAQAIQAVLGGIHAAQAAGPATANLLDANQLLHELSRREWFSVGLKAAAGLIVAATGAGIFLTVHEPAVPNVPPFRPSSPQVAALGQAWAQVQLRVAALKASPAQGRAAGNTAVIVNETVRISTELDGLLQPLNERKVMAEFLTVELTVTLRLSDRQQAYVFNLLRERLTGGDSLLTAMKAALANKAVVAEDVRRHLALIQKRRFDHTYGRDYLGFFAFLTAATAGK